MKIAIFYHCLFFGGDPPNILPHACEVTCQQMHQVERTGLLAAASEFTVGINGGAESEEIASLMISPKARRVMHGLESKNENLTLVELEKWLPSHPGWLVLYFHAKGATRSSASEYDQYIAKWRACLMFHCISGWRSCVGTLENGYEAVGAHWMPCAGPAHNQNIFAGNFWWATSDYLRVLPSIYLRDRIRVSGIKSGESRYESEVWIGNGPRLPRVKDMHRARTRVCPFDPSRFMRTDR